MGSAQTYPLVKPNVVFHSTSTTTGNGTIWDVGASKTITLSGKGTSTSRTVEFHGIDDNGTDSLINGFDKDFEQATGFTINGAVWQISVEGYSQFYCKITAIAGGNETIVGRATIWQ